MKTIKNLVEKTDKRVYVYLSDKQTVSDFIFDAENEGYTFCDGVKISKREPDEFYAVNKDNTVNFINSIGRMAFGAKSANILRVDYKKYRNGESDYEIK